MKRTNNGKNVDVEFETMKQEIVTLIQNSTDKVKISRVYESLTGLSTQGHPVHSSKIRVIT